MLKDYDLNKDLIWITFINYGYIDYTNNFLKSMKKNNINFKLIVFCNDDKTYNELVTNPQCICMKTDFLKTQFPPGMTSWGQQDYKRLVFAKLDVILYTLKETYDMGVKSVGYIDTDIFLFSDPTPIMLDAMTTYKETLVFSQCDETGLSCSNPVKCSNICSGVIVFRNIPELYSLFDYKKEDIDLYSGDQQYLTVIFEKNNIARRTIPRKQMPNGAYFSSMRRPIKIEPDVCLLHFNYMIGHQKRDCMRIQGLWLL